MTDDQIAEALRMSDGNELEAAVLLADTTEAVFVHCAMLAIRRYTRQSLKVSYADLVVSLRERTPA